MLKKISISLIIIFAFFQIFAVSASYGVPNEDINHNLPVMYWMFNGPWSDHQYANSNKKISSKGCTLTSLTMLYIYYGSYYLPDAERSFLNFLDPGKLNDWMVANDAYTDTYEVNYNVVGGEFGYRPEFNGPGGGWVFTPYNQFVVPNYCCDDQCLIQNSQCHRVEATDPRFSDLLELDTKNYIPDIMNLSGTTIRGKILSNHFAVVGGYDKANSEYRDYDPGVDFTLPARGFNKLYSTYQFKGLRRFARIYSIDSTIDVSELYYTVHSPVEIQVIDPHGRRTGYDPIGGTNLYDNPMSDYYAEQPISSIDTDDPPGDPYKALKIIRPLDGNYILRIFGTGEGPYTINIKGRKSDGTVNLSTSLTGTATLSLFETYRVMYSPTGEASLSQTNNTPVANAGVTQTGEQSYETALDGSASHDPDGDPMTYMWSFVSKPYGSGAALSDPHAIKPIFTPDLPGTYVLQLVVNDHFIDSLPSAVSITATSIKSRIAVTPNFSQPLSAGPGVIPFDATNNGRIGVTSSVINSTLTDPAGVIVSTGRQVFDLAVGGATTVNIPISIPSLKFGNYTLAYTQSDDPKSGITTMATVPNSSFVMFSFDKTIYRMRETANLTLSVVNAGKFNLEGCTLTVSVPDVGYTNSQSVNISAAQTQLFQYAIQIPSNIIAGQHNVIAALTLPSGSSLTQSARFTLQDSTLVLDVASSNQYVAGSTVILTVENQGAVDTTYTTQKLTLADAFGNVLYQGSVSDAVMAGEVKTLANVQIPSQFTGNMAILAVTLQDIKTGKLSYLNKSLVIPNGLQAGLLTRTDKDAYLNTEAVGAISTLVNNTFDIENGMLDIKVNRYRKPDRTFSLFLPKKGWYPFWGAQGVAIAPDGSTYVTETAYETHVLKFDSQGHFVGKWGSAGTDNGQFSSLYGIAVSSDGSLYVVDSGNNRIQKFDSNGSFITKWGSYGTENGQFKNLIATETL